MPRGCLDDVVLRDSRQEPAARELSIDFLYF